MNSRDWKYLIAYIAPLAALAGLLWRGPWSFGSIYVAFVLIPVVEQFLPKSDRNLSRDEEAVKTNMRLFDILLYLNIPILYGLVAGYFYVLTHVELATYELVGLTCNIGLILGTCGINVGHELGHRTRKYEQTMAKLLLLPPLYMHFFIEHNRGHHKNVATPEDPASAYRGQTVYAFWLRSVVGGYLNAWKLEAERLRRRELPVLSLHNEMLRFQLIQLAYLAAIAFLWGWSMLPYALAIAAFGFLLLESVNYIEHYGLRRREMGNGRYEKVGPQHSWNSDHELGRIFLYELTRHSDHHYKASRKYQVLRHFDRSPQLPWGYPASILMSLVPPLWFAVMHPRLEEAPPLAVQ